MTVTNFGAFDPKVNATVAALPGALRNHRRGAHRPRHLDDPPRTCVEHCRVERAVSFRGNPMQHKGRGVLALRSGNCDQCRPAGSAVCPGGDLWSSPCGRRARALYESTHMDPRHLTHTMAVDEVVHHRSDSPRSCTCADDGESMVDPAGRGPGSQPLARGATDAFSLSISP
jgi:hypothetical protein